MFKHNLKYSLKILFKNKSLLFWTFAFPIILGTLFYLAFSNIENSEKLDIIDIAIVDNQAFKDNEIFKQAFKNLSDKENKDRLFETKYVTEDAAKKLLDEKKITGYLIFNNKNPKIFVATNGINETILKYVTEEIIQTEDIIKKVSNQKINQEIIEKKFNINYEEIYKNVLTEIENQQVKLENISNKNLSYTMIEFYTLIAMSCMYGALLSMYSINKTLPNICNVGKRISVSPTKKSNIVMASAIASYIAQVLGIFLLFIYTIFVLKVDYGTNLPLIILLALVGCLAGLSLGLAVTTTIKTNENTKVGIITAFTMTGSFLSGMMGITMKYIIDKNVPIINKVNPVNMITDGLYSLYYYSGFNRYIFNVVSLLIFSAIMILISITSLRRQKYDSI